MAINTVKPTAREVVRAAFTRVENVKQWRSFNPMARALWEALSR